MTRATFRLVALTLLLTACADGLTDRAHGETRPKGTLTLFADVVGAPIATMRAQVTAPDLSTPWVFNFAIASGAATGTITVPAGADRTLTLSAFDARGIETYRGATTLTVRAGGNPTVSVTLAPLAGDVPIVARLGTILLVPAAPSLSVRVGQLSTLSDLVSVIDSTGRATGADLRWASSNPARLLVTPDVYTVALDTGRVDLVATYNGVGVSIPVTITEGTRIESLTLSADTVDVTASDALIHAAVRFSSVTALPFVNVQLTADGGARLAGACSSGTPTVGTTSVGTWECDIRLPRYSRPESLALDVYTQWDGGFVYLAPSVLRATGFPSTVVRRSGAVDLSAPTLAGLAAPGRAASVAAKGDTIAFTLATTDDRSGVVQGYAYFLSPRGGVTALCAATPDGSTAFTGSCALALPRYAHAGRWELRNLILADRVGNERRLDAAAVRAAGGATSFDVVDANEDTTAPVVTSVSVAPASLRTSDNLGVTFSGTDDRSGFREVRLVFRKGATSSFEWGCSPTLPEGPTTLTGATFFCPVSNIVSTRLTATPTGRWQFAYALAVDVVGNERRYYASEIPGGASVFFDVVP